MMKEVKRHYNRDEKGKFTKKAPKKMEPTYDSIKAAVNSVVHEFVDETREAIRVNGDNCDTSYLLDVDACLRDETGIDVSIFCSSTKINRTGAATPSYTLYSKVMIPNYDIPAYMLCIAPGMDIESNLVIFNYNATNTIVCIICALLGIDMPTLNVTGENSESADGSGDGGECDACEMECPCRNNPCCDYEDNDDDFDDDEVDDDDDEIMVKYDIIDGTEIYSMVHELIHSDTDYIQHAYALLGVKNQYTVVVYGKLSTDAFGGIAYTVLVNVTSVDKVSNAMNQHNLVFYPDVRDVLNSSACAGANMIDLIDQCVADNNDAFECCGGGIVPSEVDTIYDRICTIRDSASR